MRIPILVATMLTIMSCNVENKQTATLAMVPYKEAKRYFVKNNIGEVAENPKLISQQDFEKIFGAAAVMGKDGLPTAIDFSKEFVVAKIEKSSANTIELIPVSVSKKDNLIEIKYKKIVGEKQTYTSQTAMILILDKIYNKEIRFVQVP